MPRLKLPPYGRRLLDERRAGRHPLDVNLVYGDKGWDIATPKLWIRPDEYKPGVYDFVMLAGLRVTVHDQVAGGWEIDDKVVPPKYGKFYELLREVAACHAVVNIRWPKGVNPRTKLLLELVDDCRWFDRTTRTRVWPHWWSDALHAQQIAAARMWVADDRLIESDRATA